MMSLADWIVVVILLVCVVLSIKVMKRSHCHDCSHCDKMCGGKENGKECRKVIKD